VYVTVIGFAVVFFLTGVLSPACFPSRFLYPPVPGGSGSRSPKRVLGDRFVPPTNFYLPNARANPIPRLQDNAAPISFFEFSLRASSLFPLDTYPGHARSDRGRV